MISDKAFLDLEQSLVSEILPRWLAISKKIVPKLAVAVEEGDFTKVSAILQAVKVSTLTKGKARKIKLLFKTAVIFGASRISLTAKGLHIKEDPDTLSIVGVAHTQYLLILDQMMITTANRIMNTAVRLRERLDFEATALDVTKKSDLKKIEAINLVNLLNNAAVSAGNSMVNVASSLQMSRLSGFGFASEASLRGITTYVVNEVLDNRTCPVCRRMHGKEFKVRDALKKLDRLIRITDVEELKATSPFPKQDAESLKELDTLTSEQLQARGFDTPPYHPMCRGLLSTKKNTPALQNVQTFPLATGLDPAKGINPRVAEFIDSPSGLQLSQDAREALVSISVGVTDFAKLPLEVRELIEQLE